MSEMFLSLPKAKKKKEINRLTCVRDECNARSNPKPLMYGDDGGQKRKSNTSSSSNISSTYN